MSTELRAICEDVLQFRTAENINIFIDKLAGEGILRPDDLLATSHEALETKLQTHADFSFIEMADTLSLRRSLAERPRGRDAPGVQGPSGRDDPGASGRNNDRRGSRNNRSGSPRSRGRNNDRRGRRGARNNRSRSPRREQPKPDLWAAVERGDDAVVQGLLEDAAKNPEERFEGWTPLMKAAEENKDSIMRLLLDRSADIEAVNKKGRSALSFAAAPSMKRPTATAALKLLLERGANVAQRDNTGLTAKDRARRENRDEAVAMIEAAEKARLAG